MEESLNNNSNIYHIITPLQELVITFYVTVFPHTTNTR